VEVACERPSPRPCLLAHDLDDRADRLRGADALGADPLEQLESVRDQHAARGGWGIRHERVPAKGALHGPPPDHAIRGEVVERELAAALAHHGDDRAREFAAVQSGRAAARDRLQRVPELRHPEHVTRHEPGPALAVGAAALVGVTEDQIENGVQVRLRPR